jgi:peptide/nickel transport system permease protein
MTATGAVRQIEHAVGRTRVRSWVRYLTVRVGASLLMLVVLTFVAFLIVRLIPGDPARLIAGPDATPELVASIRARLGLDAPFSQQLTDYFGGVLQGDFGTSLRTGQSVAELVAQRLPFTLQLTIAALVLAVCLGLALGITAAYLTRDGGHPTFERAFVLTTGAVGVVPEIAIGAVLVSLLAVELQFLPASGSSGFAALILPALTVGLRPGFNLARVVRVEMLEILAQPFIQTAHSKRLTQTRIAIVHALPNTMTAILTLAGLLFAYLIGGVVVVENLFAWPGLGSTLVSAVVNRDYPVIQALILVMGALIVVGNLIVDIALGIIDPRIALQQHG